MTSQRSGRRALALPLVSPFFCRKARPFMKKDGGCMLWKRKGSLWHEQDRDHFFFGFLQRLLRGLFTDEWDRPLFFFGGGGNSLGSFLLFLSEDGSFCWQERSCCRSTRVVKGW